MTISIFIKNNRDAFERAFTMLSGTTTRLNITLAGALFAALINGEDITALMKIVKIWRENDVTDCEGYNVKSILVLKNKLLGSKHTANTVSMRETIQGVVRSFVTNTQSIRPKEWYPIKDKICLDLTERENNDLSTDCVGL